VRVKPEDAQQSRETRKIALNDHLQVWHSAPPPVLQILRRKQVHADEDVNRGHDLALGEDG
jgi:hypothetical protein